ncbi:class A beta-lactamase [Arenibacterium sp. LLYu02]|uniref:class A beta-lactamase n=1 Tax=Arenibacterium sp. LLYu02 TaxID=3404132 RepID=UPI003B21938C
MSRTSRRFFMLSFSVLAPLSALRPAFGQSLSMSSTVAFDRLEAARGGRIGVVAHDLQTGRTLSHRGDERFAMCSTFKWILGSLVLSRVDRNEESLSRELPIFKSDIVTHSPVTRELVGSSLSVEKLCEAAITRSDNTAANLVLRTLGGPEGFTNHLQAIGDKTTRLDRYETALNAAVSGDQRDTTTPEAMVWLMRQLLFGDALTRRSRDTLQRWMLDTQNGGRRLKGGIGENWEIGHKPGTNNTNVNNDVGFVRSISDPNRAPILIASFSDAPGALEDRADASHAAIAAAVLRVFMS